MSLSLVNQSAAAISEAESDSNSAAFADTIPLCPEPIVDVVLNEDMSVQAIPEKQAIALEFTGSGSEYFKIWIVNLCLTILTFGVYSAWAKVRRLQYFDRNTVLDGVPFDFHGNPKTILRGRIVAVIVLFIYHYLFGLSATFALVIAMILFALAPFMMRSSQRFRLRHTSYRGLRFDFYGSMLDAYATYLPVALMFLVPPLLAVFFPGDLLVGFSALIYLVWPWLQARMKKFQHGGFSYGAWFSRSTLNASDFVWPYFKSSIYVFLGTILAGILTAVLSNAMKLSFLIPIILTVIIFYLIYVALGPYLQVKIWNKSWEATTLGEIDFYSSLPVGAYTKLQSKNLLFTLLSLGLYRPFAVVDAYRFRLAHMNLRAHPEHLIATTNSSVAESAEGEGVAEFLGFDLSW